MSKEDIEKIENIYNKTRAKSVSVYQQEKKSLNDYELAGGAVPESLCNILLKSQNTLKYKVYLEYHVLFQNYKNGKKSSIIINLKKQMIAKILKQLLVKCIIKDLIKKFLRDLQQPLIPYQFYEKFLNIVPNFETEEKQIEELRELIRQLPIINKMTLIYLIRFFMIFTQYSAENLMTRDNFAILVSPCIFRCINDDPLKELLESKQLVLTTKLIFKFEDQIFQDLVISDLIKNIPEYS